MLKALELVGFKSFADRTRFEFPDGITVVVGPNGSGKSNVVDAVKWVLGAQSAKALRGADMADVIFKGSAEGGRKPANSAEVVLVLDNSSKIFSNDADEVHVSRRVFRSGEGEYAINGLPCRLKDVKDLFRGTGVGVDAYSLIEQGKVDRLLQASAKDRRGIFEEAAGISRFKAKKVEAERRLQRVDQNMVRLNDIVDEVGKRLNTLKNQATKANRYRELTASLLVKRQQLGWIERVTLQRSRDELNKQLQEASQIELELTEKVNSLQTAVTTEQNNRDQLQTSLDQIQSQYLEAQRELISADNGLAVSIERCAEFAAEQVVLKERITMLQQRASLSTEEIEQKKRELEEIEHEHDSAIQELADGESNWNELQAEALDTKAQLESAKSEQLRIRVESSKNRSQLEAYRLHADQLLQSIDQQKTILEQSIEELAQAQQELHDATQNRVVASHAAEQANAEKQNAEDRLQYHRLALTTAQDQSVSLQGKLHGVRERLLVLEQLEEQFTGAGRGGQQLLRLARGYQQTEAINPHPTSSIVANVWGTVLGLVADLLTTEMHLAPLIDVALGSHSDAIVLSNGQMIEWINDGSFAIDGRVTLLRMDRLTSRRSGEKIQLDGLRGVLGRADRMTKFEDAYEPLVRFLLGTTWFVDSLSTALELSHFRGAGLRFVTAECQLVESDGSITLGSLQTGLGLVSRRSEMQSAREEIKHAEQRVEASVLAVAAAQASVVESEVWLRKKDSVSHNTARELTACDLRLETVQQRLTKLETALSAHQANVESANARLAEIYSLAAGAESAESELTTRSSANDESLAAFASKVLACEQKLQAQNATVTERRIHLARIEQRSVGLRTTLEQLQQDSQERVRNVAQAQLTLENIAAKIAATELSSAELQTRSTQAKKIIEDVEFRQSEANLQIQTQNATLQQAVRQFEAARRSLEKGQDKIQTLNQQLEQMEVQWQSLHDHYVKEYQVDLQDLATTVDEFHGSSIGSQSVIESRFQWLVSLFGDQQEKWTPSAQDRDQIESEILHLRNEIVSAGSVNMEALTELDELQSRYDRLANHYSDLTEAKSGLVQTMAKIDEDSRELFMATLTTIRTNFQVLYRRSFGGGFADIVLEDPNDPDSGIEIVATPPGKTTLSNSLLSGGEKALTAVALIMAFFQYRPSPFCILDEVDAPFDEANIGRFVTVLREFLDTTKFIVVTHSKKTMTAANMIYGITMQESGVSRQVSVRFEEVGDKGEILGNSKAA